MSAAAPRVRLGARVVLAAVTSWLVATVVAAFVLPSLLLAPPMPRRTDAERDAILEALRLPEAHWTTSTVGGARGDELRVHWLKRPKSKGVVVLLHGFGDDAYGTAPRLRAFPEWDAIAFTFRGRDVHPDVPNTLGAWERLDVVAVVRFLEAHHVPRERIVIVASSMGAGVALLALEDLEHDGEALGGALLESPFEDLAAATRAHLRGTLGPVEELARVAERLAILRAGALADFEPDRVSPLRASRGRRTPIALLAGDADTITPIEGVRRIAANGYPLTVVRGARHLEAGSRVPGGFAAWAERWLVRWGVDRQ